MENVVNFETQSHMCEEEKSLDIAYQVTLKAHA